MYQSTLRILLVEDSRGDAVLVSRALEKSEGPEFELSVAGSLGEGVAHLANSFDAVLLDLTLPDSTGLATVSRMRSAAGSVPIVVLTGMDDDALGDRCIAAGATDFLRKGRLDPIDLSRILSRAIGLRR
jgi:sigma-B regulation protein RsbU (phosphoserine phosphatase)